MPCGAFQNTLEWIVSLSDVLLCFRILSREHGSLSDLGKLKTEMNPVQRPKTHIEQSGTDQFDTGNETLMYTCVHLALFFYMF